MRSSSIRWPPSGHFHPPRKKKHKADESPLPSSSDSPLPSPIPLPALPLSSHHTVTAWLLPRTLTLLTSVVALLVLSHLVVELFHKGGEREEGAGSGFADGFSTIHGHGASGAVKLLGQVRELMDEGARVIDAMEETRKEAEAMRGRANQLIVSASQLSSNTTVDCSTLPTSIHSVSLNAHEISALQSLIRPDSVYFEWGAGGSSLAAAATAGESWSVENALKLCSSLRADQRWSCFERSGKLHLMCLDGGKTDKFGVPRSETQEFTQQYVEAIGRPGRAHFDVIFVDGRYRVASALHALSYMNHTDSVLVLNDADRPEYAPISVFYDTEVRVGRMAVMRPKADVLADSEIREYVQREYLRHLEVSM
ncbi:unnamed protein product [Vitrella brassicaformis CCMP3155]|uniref:Uncharacterized protein n=1 Tax=Vitrella brassicaformis (strain CCMP3155) TaxID=1169540 RepID=A0A0G4GRM2_VITBC|nr:unnamed protein product [Vitrella brassicaformis CCMP3155]|mmetsp:Transcript_718/g.1519  ORF Transcript_718/g.1519 Transcript_718/m.1519 type:complete len:367 (-) Transcript_718:204-1304(-)|eukprot:CEM33217.1 unnamed protein product [Vitrella brassicaformis CCMP3155]